MRFTLYPIYGVAQQWDDEPFNLRQLPFDICEDVRIEAVTFRSDTFELMRTKLGEDILEVLHGVRYALVHRYEPQPVVLHGITVGEAACPFTAARKYQRIAPTLSCGPPRPLARRVPKLFCASGLPAWAAFSYHSRARP